MNNRKVLEAIQDVDEIDCLSPDASPPDILGVLAHSVHKEIPWDSLPSIKYIMEMVKAKFDLTPQDVNGLLDLSERTDLLESSKERQGRLLDVFAARVEEEDEKFHDSHTPPKDTK